jgi:hypothetical protein
MDYKGTCKENQPPAVSYSSTTAAAAAAMKENIFLKSDKQPNEIMK